MFTKIDDFAYRTFDIYNVIKKYPNYTVEKYTFILKIMYMPSGCPIMINQLFL